MATNTKESGQQISPESEYNTQSESQQKINQNVTTISDAMEESSNEEVSSAKKDTGRIWLYILDYLASCHKNGEYIPELPPMLLPFKKQLLDFLDSEDMKKANLAEEERWCQDYIETHANLPIEPEEEKIIIDDRELNTNCDNEYERILYVRPPNNSFYDDDDDDVDDSNSLLINTNIEVERRFFMFTCNKYSKNRNKAKPRRTNSKPKVRAMLRFRRPDTDSEI